MLFDASTRGQKFYLSCTPGWMNNEGKFLQGKTLNTGFPGLAVDFAKTLETRRNTDVFQGLIVR